MMRFGQLCSQHSPSVAKDCLLRTVGHGVPDINRARYSADNALTLIAESELQPFIKEDGAAASADPKNNVMNLHQLPWPVAALQLLPRKHRLKCALHFHTSLNQIRAVVGIDQDTVTSLMGCDLRPYVQGRL